MHIRDGILSPEVCVACGALSLLAVGWSLKKVREDLSDRAVPLTGMMAALIFAGQMVNFPLLGAPVSGHLLGGVLAATVLGPWAGCLAITLVLIVQAVMFSDGGLLSLGANILNMGVVGAWGGWAIGRVFRRILGQGGPTTIMSAMGAAYLSVLAAAACFCLEFALSQRGTEFRPGTVLSLMVLYHAAIGVGEAIITGLVLGFLWARRPDVVLGQSENGAGGWRAVMWAGLTLALAVAALAAPWASEWPDGLDAVGQSLGFETLATESRPIVLEDYAIPVIPDAWAGASVALAGILGTMIVFGAAIVMGRAARLSLAGGPLAGDGHGQ